MSITVSLSEKLSERLLTHAKRVKLTPQAMIEKILSAAFVSQNIEKSTEQEIGIVVNVLKLLDEQTALEHTLDIHSDSDKSLVEIVAQIKATPPNPKMIVYGDKFGDKDYIQHLLDHPPTDTMTMEEWEEYWPAIEQEFKELDPIQVISEGQL